MARAVLTGCLAALAGVLLAPAARAQEIDSRALLQRIERLESDVTILQRQLYLGSTGTNAARPAPAGGQLAPTVAASLEVRVSQLEDQLQSLTGRMEEVGHNVDQVRVQLDKLAKDIDFRLSALEHGGSVPAPASAEVEAPQPLVRPAPAAPAPSAPAPATAAVQAPPQKAAIGGGQVLPLGTPQQQYDYARALLVQQDYVSAEHSFAAFVNTHPDDPLAGAAQYWLGETFYLRANYDAAARAFAEGYQKYPKGSKAPDSLLKLGMSLVQLNRKKDACTLFNELDQRYPGAATNVKQAVQRERQRAGCT
jgi:tol-pal system protein YbgF